MIKFSVLNPKLCFRRFHSVRANSAPPVSNSRVNATCPATRYFRNRTWPGPAEVVEPWSFNICETPALVARHAGISPNSSAETTVAAAANPNTLPSTRLVIPWTPPSETTACVKMFIVQVPKISPRTPPPSAHRKLSTSSCCIIRPGEAPSAERIANSRCRAAALANSKFATFVHAISRTSATIANNAISAGPESRCRTVLPCAPGASTIFLLRNSFSSFPPLRNLRVAACCSSSPG